MVDGYDDFSTGPWTPSHKARVVVYSFIALMVGFSMYTGCELHAAKNSEDQKWIRLKEIKGHTHQEPTKPVIKPYAR